MLRILALILHLVTAFDVVAAVRGDVFLDHERVTAIAAGKPVDVIVEFDAAEIEHEAEHRRRAKGLEHDDAAIASFRAAGYGQVKRDVERLVSGPEVRRIQDYDHLPMAVWRIASTASLARLRQHSRFKAVYQNREYFPVLAQSLPLISQPTVAAAGITGSGTTVAVIDSGIDFTLAEFGSCTAVGVPATCKVVASRKFAAGTSDPSHGTNVAATVVGVAPGTKLAILNVFNGQLASTADVISAINWAIANRVRYNIGAINMSLADVSMNTSPCTVGNSFSTPIANAYSAGILTVAAAGNDGYTNAIANPACTPNVVSVGAVYDANLGGLTYSSVPCTDSATAADKVACFSNSANFLSLLAPGAAITAGGFTHYGTSQAAPHVAGAVAALRGKFPLESLGQIVARITGTGDSVVDPRNGLGFPRLNLLNAARPANDRFVNRTAMIGTSGQLTGTNELGTLESGEAAHAGNTGGHSIWFQFIAPVSGQVTLDTHGSTFSTLLGVYGGSAVGALTEIASNVTDGSLDGTSGLLFQAQAGEAYVVAVDGLSGASGDVVLNWALNSAASASLFLSMSGPSAAVVGDQSTFTLTVTNDGPQIATRVHVTDTLPSAASFVSATNGCIHSLGVVTCDAGTLSVGLSKVFTIAVLWSGAGATSNTAAASSDLPNPSPGGSSSAVATTISAQSSVAIPLLPGWGMLVFTGLLSAIGIGASTRRSR